MTQSPTLTLAAYAAASALDKIPAAVKERAKQIIFDEMASATFCRRSVAGGLAARYALQAGSAPEALILGTGSRAAAPYAALANGTAGHGEEVDGAHVAGGHPGAIIVHAAVAIAERQRASGAELLNAVVLGYDVGVRAMQACGGIFVVKSRYHLHADFLYSLGATAAACRILGLNAERICHAIGLVTLQINGLIALYAERRHISKSLCNGQYAFAGISAALMSASGMESNEDIIGAEHGLLDAWGIPEGREIITRGLGQDFSVMGGNFKLVNAGYPIHAAVEAAMTIVRQHKLAPETIQSVHVGMPENAMRVVDNRDMHNICLQDMMSAALVRGGLSLRERHFPAILADPAYQSMRARVTLGVDPGLQRDQPNGRGSHVTIKTADGASHAHRVDHPRGHSLRGGVTWDDLSEKWRDGLPGYDVGAMLAHARGLDHLEDVRTLTSAFAGAG